MDVIALLLMLIVLGLILGGLLYVLAIGGLVAFALWPAIGGIVAGVFLWRAGHDNLGVVVGLLGIVGTFIWAKWLSSGPIDYTSSSDYSETTKDILRDIRDKLDR